MARLIRECDGSIRIVDTTNPDTCAECRTVFETDEHRRWSDGERILCRPCYNGWVARNRQPLELLRKLLAPDWVGVDAYEEAEYDEMVCLYCKGEGEYRLLIQHTEDCPIRLGRELIASISSL